MVLQRIIFLLKTLNRGGQHKRPAAVNSNTRSGQHNAPAAVNLLTAAGARHGSGHDLPWPYDRGGRVCPLWKKENVRHGYSFCSSALLLVFLMY